MTTQVFVKRGSPELLRAEVDGLQFLRVAGGPRLPAVIACDGTELHLERVEPGRPTAAAAADFGQRLARMHTSGEGARFGAAFPGFIGPLPLDNTWHEDWPSFYAERRLLPYMSGLDDDTVRAVEDVIACIDELAGPAEPPARVHGDLWSGNVLWAADGFVWLVDTGAAHLGHRETDLAMLALFGAPYLEEIRRAYDEVAPLAVGWRDRVALHQLHPLLVHAQLFGGGYVEQVRAASRALVHTR